MKSKHLFLVCLLGTGLILSMGTCRLPSSGGSLTVSIADEINARTLLPPICMEAERYTVVGTGPNGAGFDRATYGGSVTVECLMFGTWSITVEALNADGTVIGRGEAPATVHTGETATVSITVTPLAGDGTLDLTVRWPADQVERPSILVSLTPPSGSATSLNFTVSGNEALCVDPAVSAGYRTLTLQLLDNEIPVIGAVEVVRIVVGQTTSGTYEFENVNMPGGTLVVDIDPALADPIPVSIGGVPPKVAIGAGFTATATVDDGTPNVICVWYLNEVSKATGSSISFGSALGLGYYRLDVTVFSADGTRAGSATESFQVVPFSDGFESYAAGTYPSTGGWYTLWSGTGNAGVVSGTAFEGAQSFRLEGYTSWVRADGLNLALDGRDSLTYRAAVMVPSGSATGATMGFFIRKSPNTSTAINHVSFTPGSEIAVYGRESRGTGVIFRLDTWYDVKVEIDYVAAIMNVWVNGHEVVWDLPARDKSMSSIFFIGTNWSGSVYATSRAFFDNVVIY